MKANRQHSEIRKWFFDSHEILRKNLGDEATRKLIQLLESQGILKQPRKVGRPAAPKDLQILSSKKYSSDAIINVIMNSGIRTAKEMAKTYAIMSRLDMITPDTPMKTVYNGIIELIRFPWDKDSSFCCYKTFTEACRTAKATEDDCKKFLKDIDKAEEWLTLNQEQEGVYYEIEDESYSQDEIDEYLQYLRSEAQDYYE